MFWQFCGVSPNPLPHSRNLPIRRFLRNSEQQTEIEPWVGWDKGKDQQTCVCRAHSRVWCCNAVPALSPERRDQLIDLGSTLCRDRSVITRLFCACYPMTAQGTGHILYFTPLPNVQRDPWSSRQTGVVPCQPTVHIKHKKIFRNCSHVLNFSLDVITYFIPGG